MFIEKITFENSVLYMSVRSPFARRVRLTLLENKIPFDIQVLDVFKPNPELIRLNPLARVPTLVLRGGDVLVDSNQIIDVFYRVYPESPLNQLSQSERLRASFWSAMGVGLCEKTVEYFLDTLRPEAQQDRELQEEMRSSVERIFPLLNQQMANRDFIIEGKFSQADIDVGCALGYLRLRYLNYWNQAKNEFSSILKYLERLDARPAFQETAPPPA